MALPEVVNNETWEGDSLYDSQLISAGLYRPCYKHARVGRHRHIACRCRFVGWTHPALLSAPSAAPILLFFLVFLFVVSAAPSCTCCEYCPVWSTPNAGVCPPVIVCRKVRHR
jgi:hypothetical protein